MESERRDPIVQPETQINRQREESGSKAKPFCISKRLVFEAYERVKANKGAPGVDGESIESFESNLKDNLYRLWNRLSSGSYFPPPVKGVEIPKADGKTRLLGIPTVSDRIAQTVVKMQLEPIVEPKFHADSYGYRPGRSAHHALDIARKRCWKYAWVIDMDIRAFFDSIDHDLMMKAVKVHSTEPWVLLYIARWLKAPLQVGQETTTRDRGTPQGGVISPLLANIFLHHAFDDWMRRRDAHVPFERYADDVLVHCRSRQEAEKLLGEIERRLRDCGLELHPEKTRIVYCKDGQRSGRSDHESFDFLGYTFRARRSFSRKNGAFLSFNPAVSAKSAKAIREEIRRWHIGRHSDRELVDIARMVNARVRGWVQYFGKFFRSALHRTIEQIEFDLVQWAQRKYKRLKKHKMKAVRWLSEFARREPQLFEHWKLGLQSKVA